MDMDTVRSWKTNVVKFWPLYIMVLPGFVFLVMFKVVPLLGTVIAFQDFQIFRGIADSPWVGLKHFESFFEYSNFSRVFMNTVIIGGLKLLIGFPFPIILALMINEVRQIFFKRTVQTISYLPHFFSWVIIAGLTFDILSAGGIVNEIRSWFGADPILFMQKAGYFRFIVVLTGIWKEAGWGTIVLLAALSGINPQLYEAATVDGAGRFKQMWFITLPLLMPTVVILFLLNIGSFLDIGFEQVYNLLTPMTYEVGDIIDTYVYRAGIVEGQYSLSTAIGIFQSVIGLVLIVSCNKLSKKVSGEGLW
ncbi:sugar ABC transporter permease [Paenibacillus sonchi]|uniref:Sugar ABC transporter permease n=2 Tax=Paenibacillus sonchi TaxID=373687 RepID=A0A974PGT0_9BACL|nr:ABC transporter permease subunit [Paenibacillus sonchi]QQZ63677.1 sugar ABC transporter permease [Paenibacillus sonchi]